MRSIRLAHLRVFVRHVSVFVVLSGAAMPNVQARGYFYDGNELLRLCQASATFCRGFVAGITDHQSWVERGDVRAWYCVPENATIGQLTDVVLKHLDQHPESRHNTAVSLVAIALYDAFPC